MRSLRRLTLAAALALPLVMAGCSDDHAHKPGPADLSELVISAGALSPAFSLETTFYTVEGILPSTVTVTPFAWDPAATITVDGASVASGTPSLPVTLGLGMNTVTVVVTARNGVTLNSYMILFLRGGPAGQEAYLKASNTEVNDRFGCAVAVDGDTVVVGAYFEDSSETGTTGSGADNSALRSGAAYVFVRSGGVWQQEAYLKASNTDADDWFGFAVAVDGDTVVVGAPHEDSTTTTVNGNEADNSASNSGAAYVFVRSGGVWTQEAYLKASNTDAWDQFGRSVAVDGDTVVVGAYGEDSNETGTAGTGANNTAGNSGAAYVFVRSGGTWTHEAYLKASNTEMDDWFGCAVAVHGDTIVVGAYGEDSNETGTAGTGSNNLAQLSGAAYVFVRSGGTWTHEAYLKASNTDANAWFGYAVAVDGDTVVVGACYTALQGGAAYVFVRSGGVWTQEAYLEASNTDAGDQFGCAVAIDGDTVVVGAYEEDSSETGTAGSGADNGAQDSGAAYVFVRSGGAWTQEAYLKASNTDWNDYFGSAVAVDGDSVVVGAPWEDSNETGTTGTGADNSAADSGAVYVFR